MQLITLINLTDQFISGRSWWLFHNPKNDANNILIEASELAELFIKPSSTTEQHQACAEELSDVLCATFAFSIVTKIDLVQLLLQRLSVKADSDSSLLSYTELQASVLSQLAPLGLKQFSSPTQVTLSLIYQAGRLADLFHWQSDEESKVRVQVQIARINQIIVLIIAHLVWLSHLLEIDLPVEFERKMQKNMRKFPVDQACGSSWVTIKDRLR